MKSEKPTKRRLLTQSRKGSSYKSRDVTVACMLIVALLVLSHATALDAIEDLLTTVIGRNFAVSPSEIALLALKAFLWAVAPVAIACIVCVALVSLVQSRGVLATEALKIDFNRLNPVSGFKNLFSLKSVKSLVSAFLYLVVTVIYVGVAWKVWGAQAFALAKTRAGAAGLVGHQLLMDAALGMVAALLPLVMLAGVVELLLYLREMRMEKSEVKQEHKDSEGNPDIKKSRKERAAELSAQVQSDVAGSSLILANPTHIAVGIYVHDVGATWPLVSVHEKGERALAVIALAEKLGIPVVRDIPLARSVYRNSKRYQFVPLPQVEAVARLLQWLRDVERAGRDEPAAPPE